MLQKYIIGLFLLIGNLSSVAQNSIDHWETVVFADDIWRYRIGNSEPPADWMLPSFNDNSWLQGQGGFGYADGDDNTIIPAANSVYLRRDFILTDTAKIAMAVLHADYDDAFVAYLNGTEISRANIGTPGIPPAFDETLPIDHEAQLYQGGVPEAFPVYQDFLKSLIQNGTNTLAIQVNNVSINSSDLSSNFFFSLGITDTSTDYDPTPAWFYEPFSSSNLPLIIINTNGQGIPDEPRIVADMGIIDNGPGERNALTDPFNGYDGKIAIEIRGASSVWFPKNNYGFETQDEYGDNLNVSLLGMPEENDWVLHGPFADKSLIRNDLSFYLGRKTGQYASRTRFCELIVDNQYLGLYVLMERIKQDDNRVDIAKLLPEDIEGDELTGGYILQIDRDDENTEEDGWWSPYPDWIFYAFDDPDYDVLQPVQKAYIRNFIEAFEQMMDGPNYADQYLDYINVSSFVDYFIVNELAKHVDAFKLSFFMYKRKDSNGGKLHFGPIWDFNLGYGNFDFECDPDPEGWIYPCTSRAFWLDKLLTIPYVQNQIHCRWEALRQTAYQTDSLLNYIDNVVMSLEEAQERNFDRWPILGQYVWPNNFVGNTYEEEIDFLKDWLVQRLNWMDNNILGIADCTVVGTENVQPAEIQTEVFPNPVYDRFSVKITLHTSHSVSISLYDILGKENISLLSNTPATSGENIWHFDLPANPKGAFLLKMIIGDKIVTKKLVFIN